MSGVGLTPLAVFLQLHTIGSGLLIFLGRVIPAFTLSTRQGDQCAHYCSLGFFLNPVSKDTGSDKKIDYYLIMFVTRPEPTVRPPSRMAKRRPSSMAIGLINSPRIKTLSPGMTISMPSGK